MHPGTGWYLQASLLAGCFFDFGAMGSAKTQNLIFNEKKSDLCCGAMKAVSTRGWPHRQNFEFSRSRPLLINANQLEHYQSSQLKRVCVVGRRSEPRLSAGGASFQINSGAYRIRASGEGLPLKRWEAKFHHTWVVPTTACWT